MTADRPYLIDIAKQGNGDCTGYKLEILDSIDCSLNVDSVFSNFSCLLNITVAKLACR